MNNRERLKVALAHCSNLRKELIFSHGWISKELINEQWVRELENDELKKERVSAFCARFGKFQDYLTDKVMRLWLEVVGEHVGTALENFSVAERAGVLSVPSEQMVEIRAVRNRLTHEYIENAKEFSSDINAVIQMTPALLDTLQKIELNYLKVTGKS